MTQCHWMLAEGNLRLCIFSGTLCPPSMPRYTNPLQVHDLGRASSIAAAACPDGLVARLVCRKRGRNTQYPSTRQGERVLL